MTYEFSHIVPPRRLRGFDYDPENVRNALEYGKELGKPLESARILIGNTGSSVDSRRLARDAIALQLKDAIVFAALRRIEFYGPDDNYLNVTQGSNRSIWLSLWTPRYRNLNAMCRNRKDDRKILNGIEALPVVLCAPGGVVRASASAFDELSSQGKKVFWIDTQDYMDADGLLRDFLRGVALRFGSFQSRHVTLHPLDRPITEQMKENGEHGSEVVAEKLGSFIKRVLDDYRADATSIIVMIYGRDGYGGCSGLVQSNWKVTENRTNSTRVSYDSFDALHCLIESLGRANIQVIYFPLLPKRAKEKVKSIESIQVKPNEKDKNFSSRNRMWQDSTEWSRDALEPSLTRQWQADPNVDLKLEENIAKMPLLRSMITRVLAKHYSYDQIEASILEPRFNRLGSQFEKQLHFLYAITLFRHSRHPNALCSEATFPCPFRHNHSSIDNDFIRAEESSRWLTELRDARVFFDKPGGSLWMHRDVRISLKRLLEQSPLAPSESTDDTRRNRHFSEVRARLHFWIGDWYFKAFCSSGHLTPVIESIHHRVSAALCAPFARPKYGASIPDRQVWEYRIGLFESAILECSKTLLVAWHWLHLWQACSFEASWVTEKHRSEVCLELRKSCKKLSLGIDPESLDSTISERQILRVMRAIDSFEKLLESLANSLTGEGGGSKKATLNADPYSNFVPGDFDNGSQDAVPQGKLDLDHSLFAINKATDQFHSELKSRFCEVFGDVWKTAYEDLRAISSRPISFKERADLISTLSEKKAKWKASVSAPLTTFRRIVWLLSESAYTVLRRAKLNFHATGEVDFESWMLVTELSNLGIDFCKHLSPSQIDFEISSKTKLHCLYAIALSNLGRFFEANRHLNEAQGLQSKSRLQFRNHYAVLNLRRAEVKLTECFWVGLVLTSDIVEQRDEQFPSQVSITSPAIKRAFGVDGLLLGDKLGDGEWSVGLLKRQLQNWPDHSNPAMFVPARISECCRKAHETGREWKTEARLMLIQLYSSALNEASALLDQAERQLSGSSQSNLWWSRLHTLRLRVYGLLLPLKNNAASTLALRKYAPDIGIYVNFTNALRIAQHDDFRRLRAIRYFLEANHWYSRFAGSESAGGQSLLPDTMQVAKNEFAVLWEKYCTDSKLAAKGKLDLNDPSKDNFRFELSIARLARKYAAVLNDGHANQYSNPILT